MEWKSVKLKKELYDRLKLIDPSLNKAIEMTLEGKPSKEQTDNVITRLDKHRDRIKEMTEELDKVKDVLEKIVQYNKLRC